MICICRPVTIFCSPILTGHMSPYKQQCVFHHISINSRSWKRCHFSSGRKYGSRQEKGSVAFFENILAPGWSLIANVTKTSKHSCGHIHVSCQGKFVVDSATLSSYGNITLCLLVCTWVHFPTWISLPVITSARNKSVQLYECSGIELHIHT